MSRTTLRPRRRSGGHARRPGTSMRRRVGARLPSGGRIAALLLLAVGVAGLVTLVNGPWLRVAVVAHDGGRFTSAADLDLIMDDYQGAPLLSVDSEALRRRLAELPAVAGARIEMRLPGELRVSISEKAPSFVWRTSAVRLVGAADGTIIAELPLVGAPEPELDRLPKIDDERFASRGLTVGDQVPESDLRVALRLLDLDPELIGSRARRLLVSVDDEFGFLVSSTRPEWQAALGFYELDPKEDRGVAEARLDSQLAAIRTLFATRREVAVSWLDVRNPGKVYWAP